MKTNSKEVRNLIKAHIFENVTDNEGNLFTSFNEAAKEVQKEFDRVANYPYNIQKFPNHQMRFSDWLNGLPFSFLFYYSDVRDFLNGLGINPTNKEYSDSQVMKTYHYLIFDEVMKVKY